MKPCTFKPKSPSKKQKISLQKKFLIFLEMELSSSNIKKNPIFSQKKAFLIFLEMELLSPKFKKNSS